MLGYPNNLCQGAGRGFVPGRWRGGSAAGLPPRGPKPRDRRSPVIVDCALYRNGRRQRETPMSLEEAAAICAGEPEGFVWLGMFEPSPEELSEVQDRFGLHELAVEDAQSFHLRPKIELYADG